MVAPPQMSKLTLSFGQLQDFSVIQMTILNQVQISRQVMKYKEGLAGSKACYLFPTILQID